MATIVKCHITRLCREERGTVFGNAKMTTVLYDRLTNRCHILETGNDNFPCKASSAAVAAKNKQSSHVLTTA